MSEVEKIRCDACPVMCYIAPGQTGACDRYANDSGRIIRTDPVVMLSHAVEAGHRLVPFATRDWDGDPLPKDTFVTAIGSGTTYPDYKPAPFIVSSRVEGADMVTVVTEAIFSYCGVKVKIDTDRYLGPEGAVVRAGGGGDWPCHHRRIWQPDAVFGRGPSPDGRIQGRRSAHLFRHAGALQR